MAQAPCYVCHPLNLSMYTIHNLDLTGLRVAAALPCKQMLESHLFQNSYYPPSVSCKAEERHLGGLSKPDSFYFKKDGTLVHCVVTLYVFPNLFSACVPIGFFLWCVVRGSVSVRESQDLSTKRPRTVSCRALYVKRLLVTRYYAPMYALVLWANYRYKWPLLWAFTLSLGN